MMHGCTYKTSQSLFVKQVQEHIFTESNTMVKSIQVFLDALNELRSWHVMERSSGALKREGSKASVMKCLGVVFL